MLDAFIIDEVEKKEEIPPSWEPTSIELTIEELDETQETHDSIEKVVIHFQESI